jgi:putative SOS response-associated peptidase YedK
MCYNVKALLQSQLKRARIKGLHEEADAIQLELKLLGTGNYNHVSGFDYPKIVMYSDADSHPIIGKWGFVPATFKGEDPIDFLKRFRTLNARGEDMFDSIAYKNAAESRHCLIYVNGFYDHHHQNGVKYPFIIRKKDVEEFPLAGIWDEWINPKTKDRLKSFSIVTTEANKMMSRIHNNPEREGPRMPVILDDMMAEEWLKSGFTQSSIEPFLVPFPDHFLKAHTVKPLTGKSVLIKNDPSVSDEILYKELKLEL